MILDPEDDERFFKLHKALTLFVNQRLKITKHPPSRKGSSPYHPSSGSRSGTPWSGTPPSSTPSSRKTRTSSNRTNSPSLITA
jgi:hypothetical protein